MRQGRYEDSLSLLNSPLPAPLSRTDIAVWRFLTQASSLTYLSRFPEAQKSLAEAQSLAASAQPQLLGEVSLRQGTLASLQWNMSSANSLFHASLSFARDHHDPFLEASALGSLAVAAARMEHHDESIDWNKQSLALDLAHSWLSLASKAEGNLAWSYYELGDYESALQQYQKAEDDSIRAGLDHERVLWLTNSAITNFALHDYQSAQQQSAAALALAIKFGDPSDIIDCRQNSAVIAIQNAHYQDAADHLKEAARLSEQAPDVKSALYTRLLSAHLLARSGDFTSALDSYSSIAQDPASPTSLRWEAQASLAQVHAAQGNAALAEQEFRSAISTINHARDALAAEDFRLSFLSSAIRFYDAYVNFLIDQRRPLDALAVADLSRAQTLEEGLSSGGSAKSPAHDRTAPDPRAIAARFHASLLFYWLGPRKSWFWLITPAKISLFPLPAGPELDEPLKTYRESFNLPVDPLESPNSDGQKLYSVLLQPVQSLLPKNSRVVILPDGNLNSLNFESLVVPCAAPCAGASAAPHYWIEDATVLTANSLSLLARSSSASPPQAANLFLMGDTLTATPEFPALPQAGKEVALLEKYFPPSRRLEFTGHAAVPSAFSSSAPEKFSYLHFATHGTASSLRPLESAVILSREGDSYKLYARDVVRHPLAAYLVTISACNGAGTKTYAGEGLVGLSWAFLRAGAHNVIAGLWEVSNASTPQLMDELYKGLHAGQDPATALRNAKLTLVHSSGNYRRPFYWAPFLLYSGS